MPFWFDDPELEQMLEDAAFEETHPCAIGSCLQLPVEVRPVDEVFYETLCPQGHWTIWERSEDA